MKKYWRCTICGDLHWGKQAPEKCPTCGYPRKKAIQITKKEFLKALES